MKKVLKCAIGLLLLPLCWAFSRVLFFLLQSPDGMSGSTAWAIPIGFAVSAIGFFLLPRPFRAYVLAHELTHAVWGLLMGAKVGKMNVGKMGGHVLLSKSNFLIALAPYFFPFYTGVVIALWCVARCFFDLSAHEFGWLVLIGLTWGFHITFTVYILSQQQQPDVQEQGRVFSCVVIYLANLLMAALWMILIGSPTFSSAWNVLQSETLVAYKWVGGALLSAWNQMKNGIMK